MKRFHVVLLLVLAGCPKPTPGEPQKPGIIQCASEAVQKKWPQVLPAVNRCLASAADADWVGCLVGLIEPAAGITESVIACTVRSSGARYADAAKSNDADKMSVRAASRAQAFLADRGYRFAP